MLSAFLIGLTAGVANTPHCLGMCGGFALHLGKSSRDGSAVVRHMLFAAGKTFTYVFLGVIAATLGVVVFKDTRLAPNAPVLGIVAGAVTVLFGLVMLGLRLPMMRAPGGTGFFSGLLGGLLVSPSRAAAFVLGLGVGFLPCPLPMGMLAAAVGYHSIPYAVALMAGVGLGTAPGLVAVGLFGVGMNKRFARVGTRVTAVIVLAIGLVTIVRASGALAGNHASNKSVQPSCCGGVER